MRYKINSPFSLKNIILFAWILVILGIFSRIYQPGLPVSAYSNIIAEAVRAYGIWSPLIFISLFALRPLVFFPATILSLSAGVLFGPVKAVLILIIAENLSSAVSYSVGKFLGQNIFNKVDTSNTILTKFNRFLHQNDFISILTLRLMFAPFDLVGYFAGASSISYPAFALATFLGILPGLISSAFLGGSVNDSRHFIIALAFIILGLGISRLIKHRHTHHAKTS